MSLMLSIAFWNVVTRLGEAQIMVPAALMVALWFGWRDQGHKRVASVKDVRPQVG